MSPSTRINKLTPQDLRTKLCGRCRGVQWHNVADTALPDPVWAEVLFAIKETCEELLASQCPVCQLIGHIRNPDSSREEAYLDVRCMCGLLAGQARSRHHTKGFEHSPLFRVVSYDTDDLTWSLEGIFGVLHPWSEHDGLAPRYVDPQSVDRAIIQQWFQFCEDNHKNTCTPIAIQHVPGFKVIDCRTKCVVELPQQKCRYAALSYVWGDQSPSDHVDNIFPKTIEDAFEVCLVLGLQYLWVDVHVRLSLTWSFNKFTDYLSASINKTPQRRKFKYK